MTHLLLLLTGAALANGQTTHIWITWHAVEHLPDGDLRDLLTDSYVENALVHGTMFPDGGYSPVQDPYGEYAHWEPFQGAYLDWIQAAYTTESRSLDDLSPTGRQHTAFLMGLASHGMADQLFDSLYMERAKQEDADSDWAELSMDEATDVVFAHETGAAEVPDAWVPYETVSELMRDALDHEIAVEDMEDGQWYLELAVAWVGSAGQQPDTVDGYSAQFPWATAHLLDDLPGAPPCEGEIIAGYWQVLADRLMDRSDPTDLGAQVLATWPRGDDLALDAGTVQARVSIAFATALLADSVTPDAFSVTDPTGADVPVEPWLFYRDGSHVVHLLPEQDWAEDTVYTVTVEPTLETLRGPALTRGYGFEVRTKGSDTPADLSDVPLSGCEGCATGPAAPLAAYGVLGALLGLIRRRRT